MRVPFRKVESMGKQLFLQGFFKAAIIVSAFALVSCNADGQTTEGEGQGPAPNAVRVETTPIESQAVEFTATLQGRTRPFAVSEVRPQVTGLIEARLFEEGRAVAAGEPLYQIDDSEYVTALQSAKAALARAKANAAVARENAKRFDNLVGINAVSRQQLDEAEANYAQARADVAMQEAAVSRAQIDLDRTVIRAPIDGKIGRSFVTPGALVTANQADALSTIRQLDPLYVDLTASASDILKWKREMAAGNMETVEAGKVPVTISLEDGTSYEHKGELAFSEVSVDESAGTVVLRAIVPNPDGYLLPGMFVRAQLPVGQMRESLLVPQAGVMRTPAGDPYALVVAEDGTAQSRPLNLAQSHEGNWVVTDGLSEGENVIVSGLTMLRPGSPVTVVNETISTASAGDAATGGSK